MSNRLVSVIIVTAGVKNYIKSCLASIEEQTYFPLEIIVINNSSNRILDQELCRYYPDIKLYPSPKNLFYCEALNRGIEMSKGDFILCLNDDVILDKDFIKEALKGFGIGERIGMVSGKILRYNQQTIDSTGLFISLWRTAKERGHGLKDRGQFEKEEYIFGVNGAVAFYRREMLEDIKKGMDYFDSDFHIFYEDLDIAWRAQNFGWRGYYVPRAVAYHIRGATVREGKGINKKYARSYLSDELHIDLLKNRYLTIIKNETFLVFLLHLPFIILYDIIVWGYVVFFRHRLIKKFFLRPIPINSAFRTRKLLKRLRDRSKVWTCP